MYPRSGHFLVIYIDKCLTFATGSIVKKRVRIFKKYFSLLTRKYPLRGYILGVLAHTTAWDRLWGGDYFKDCRYVARLRLAMQQQYGWAFGTLTMWF